MALQQGQVRFKSWGKAWNSDGWESQFILLGNYENVVVCIQFKSEVASAQLAYPCEYILSWNFKTRYNFFFHLMVQNTEDLKLKHMHDGLNQQDSDL